MTAQAILFIQRTLQGQQVNSESSSYHQTDYSALVFWGVNIFLLISLITACACFLTSHSWLLRHTFDGRGESSDVIYARAVLERRRLEEERKKDTPQQRKQKLLKSFERNNVRMVVKEGDVTDEVSTSFTLTEMPVEAASGVACENGSGDGSATMIPDMVTPRDIEGGLPIVDTEIEECETGYLMLPCKRSVPNCCAICICPYEIGDSVVWSPNAHCKHAFHEDCMMDWLTKKLDATPCPCCRQEFTDLKAIAAEKKITWTPGYTFAHNVIVLR